MERTETPHFLHYRSVRLALAWCTDRPRLAFLGVESGGRTDRHHHNNLLVTGRGMVPRAASGRGEPRDGGIAYPGWMVTIPDEDTFVLEVSGGEAWTPILSLAPAVSPPTLWSRSTEGGNAAAVPPPGGQYDHAPLRTTYGLPLVAHFPDYGLVRIDADGAVVRCHETWVPDAERSGLNLGYANTGYHTRCVAYHHGRIELAFDPAEPGSRFRLVFRVLDEVAPIPESGDFRGAEWDGLRRCWMNAFTLDRRTLTMGDNILLGGVGHLSIHFKSDMSVYTPPVLPEVTLHQVLGRALEATLEHAQGDNGDLNWAYLDPWRRSAPLVYGFSDGAASNLIALANHRQAAGDPSLAARHRGAVLAALRYLLSLDTDGDGILESLFHGNRMEEPRTRNWWDNFAFGHKDAYFNLLAHRALRRGAPLALELGDSALAREIERFLGAFARAFHATFWREDTGGYAGWVSRDGRSHDYRFTFIAGMAVCEGLVEAGRARRVLTDMLARMRALGYDFRYGVPGNLVSVAPEDTIGWEAMGRWGVYENGGLCGQTAYPFLRALYRVGLRDEADEILFRMIATFEREPTHSGVFPGYLRSLDWRTKEGFPCGYNYLADNYYFLLAAITGHYGPTGT